MITTTNFKAGQLVRISNLRSLAYGRVAMVMTAEGKERSLVRFADLPKTVSAAPNPAGFTETFATSDLTLITNVPIAALYLLVTIVERDGDRRYAHHCLANGIQGQRQETLADSIAQCWYESGGEWDAAENAWRFDTHHFVLAEDWRELTIAEYINLATDLTDCTPGYTSGPSYGENTEAEYIRRQTRGLD
ncbi:MAG: hypothetical protein DCF15_06070 [Phormidesmis priestleyi]|uniref:Uncharacterized protein n=1 Tax=Phormidesmis priestleyi TaxID=268141 RepID=A0A2W4XM48_9CYAN|nr:MAG: hypothetical protein DCF15_06070 [Phormidesmis priestleyi]